MLLDMWIRFISLGPTQKPVKCPFLADQDCHLQLHLSEENYLEEFLLATMEIMKATYSNLK